MFAVDVCVCDLVCAPLCFSCLSLCVYVYALAFNMFLPMCVSGTALTSVSVLGCMYVCVSVCSCVGTAV